MASNLRLASAVLPIFPAIAAVLAAPLKVLVAVICAGEALLLIVIAVWTWLEIAKIERSVMERREAKR